MKLDRGDVIAAAGIIGKAMSALESSFRTDWLETDLRSSMRSVDSFDQQIKELAKGPHQIGYALTWHVNEGDCVAYALHRMSAVINYVDEDYAAELNGVYAHQAKDLQHHSALPDLPDRRGLGFTTKDGRSFETFTPHGIPLIDEPVGRSLDEWVQAFDDMVIHYLWDTAAMWEKVGRVLDKTSEDMHRAAHKVQSAGDEEAYTYQAGLGIHRWADSSEELARQIQVISKKIVDFGDHYGETAGRLLDLRDKRGNTPYPQQARAQYSASQPDDYDQAANELISEHYNPGLHKVDTSTLELPVPMRAVRPEYFAVERSRASAGPINIPSLDVHATPMAKEGAAELTNVRPQSSAAAGEHPNTTSTNEVDTSSHRGSGTGVSRGTDADMSTEAGADAASSGGDELTAIGEDLTEAAPGEGTGVGVQGPGEPTKSSVMAQPPITEGMTPQSSGGGAGTTGSGTGATGPGSTGIGPAEGAGTARGAGSPGRMGAPAGGAAGGLIGAVPLQARIITPATPLATPTAPSPTTPPVGTGALTPPGVVPRSGGVAGSGSAISASSAAAGRASGVGPGMSGGMMAPMSGAGAATGKGKGAVPRRKFRSQENTRRLLNLTPQGVPRRIRHPDDPLLGTGH